MNSFAVLISFYSLVKIFNFYLVTITLDDVEFSYPTRPETKVLKVSYFWLCCTSSD